MLRTSKIKIPKSVSKLSFVDFTICPTVYARYCIRLNRSVLTIKWGVQVQPFAVFFESSVASTPLSHLWWYFAATPRHSSSKLNSALGLDAAFCEQKGAQNNRCANSDDKMGCADIVLRRYFYPSVKAFGFFAASPQQF